MEIYSSHTVGYTLYLYREELRRPEVRYTRLSKTKLTLTDELITKYIRNMKQCNKDDLQAISREIQFKKTLKTQLHRMRKLENLGMKNVSPSIESTEL